MNIISQSFSTKELNKTYFVFYRTLILPVVLTQFLHKRMRKLKVPYEESCLLYTFYQSFMKAL